MTGLPFPRHIALDVAAGKMYWTDQDPCLINCLRDVNLIKRANLNGTDVEEVVTRPRGHTYYRTYFEGLALDVVAGKVYFAAQPSPAAHAMLALFTAGEAVCQIGLVPKTVVYTL